MHAAARTVSKTNPLGLVIGERVTVCATASVGYVDDTRKELFRSPRNPVMCFVTGITRKATGKYLPASYQSSFDGDDYNQAELQVDKYHTLYECRIRIESKPFLVHPDDVQVLEDSGDASCQITTSSSRG